MQIAKSSGRGTNMFDRKIKKAAIGLAMSIVLVAAGCASAAPDREEAQSDLQEEAVQESTGQEGAALEDAGQQTEGQEEDSREDVFDFEEADQSAPAANGEMPSKYDLRDVQVKGSGIVPPIRLQNPFGTCWSFGAIAAAETSISLTD